jgi:GTPase SAR1 family protein
VHKILVANKIDMDDQRRISKEAGRRCAQRYNMEYFEVSAKEGTNISTAFLEVSRQIKLALDE